MGRFVCDFGNDFSLVLYPLLIVSEWVKFSECTQSCVPPVLTVIPLEAFLYNSFDDFLSF